MSKRPAETNAEDASPAQKPKLELDVADNGPVIRLKSLHTNREADILSQHCDGAHVSISERVAGAVERVLVVEGTQRAIAEHYSRLLQHLFPDLKPQTIGKEDSKLEEQELVKEKSPPPPAKKKGGRKSAAQKAAEAAAEAEAEAAAEKEAAALASAKAASASVKMEDIEQETARSYTLRLVVPHVHLEAITGKAGANIGDLMSRTEAHVQPSEFNLPLSTERCIIVRGTIEAISRAIGAISEKLQIVESASSMVIEYRPVTLGGVYGHPESFRRIEPNDTMKTPSNPYGIPPSTFAAPAPAEMQPSAGTTNGKPVSKSKETVTQQIYIPNDMVGAIIGKQGSKINEIRNLSGSHVKVNEPDPARVTERLITIEGTAEQNQLALYMLYQRLESEKRRG